MSSHDIVAVTTSAAEALEAIGGQMNTETIFDDIPNTEIEEFVPESVEIDKEKHFVLRDGDDIEGKPAREISPLIPESNVEIVDVAGSTTRFRDRTLTSQQSVSSTGRPEAGVPGSLTKGRKGDSVRITRFAGNTKECRQKLASRKKFNDASSYQHDYNSYPKVVQAQLISHNVRSSIEKSVWDQYEKENRHNQVDQTAILSAATSAAAAAAVGTQPVLKEIESRINELSNKLTSLETTRPDTGVMLTPAASNMEERLLRELAVERELARERERQRKREDHRREKDNEKFQRRLMAFTALQNSAARRGREERKSLPPSIELSTRRPRFLEEILQKEACETPVHQTRERSLSPPVEDRKDTQKRLHNFEWRLNSELAGIRTEFEELRQRAEAISTAEPADVSMLRPRVSVLSEAPPRNEVLELADRQLERINNMQENLDQNIASIERAREVEFFYSVLNDLSGDQNAVNSAVTRIMVDDALKRASREAKRQVEKEWRSGRPSSIQDGSDMRPPLRQPPKRRGPQAKVDSGLRRRNPSPSPPRDNPDEMKPSSVFGSINSLVDFNILQPGQLGNRRQKGRQAPYLHYTNPLKERQHSPVAAVRYQSPTRPPREASASPVRRPRDEDKRKGAHVLKQKVSGRGRHQKTAPRCQLLFFRQHDAIGKPPRHTSPEKEIGEEEIPIEIKVEKSISSPKSKVSEVAFDESRNVTPTASVRSLSEDNSAMTNSAQIPDDVASTASEATRRSEDGKGLELPGWRRQESRRPPPTRQKKLPLDERSTVRPSVPVRSGRDPLETVIRNRLEDEVIAEVVTRIGLQRESAVQTYSPPPAECDEDDGAQLRDVVQEVVLTEAMRLLRRSLPHQSPRVAVHDTIRVPTPIPSPEGPSMAEEKAVDYSDEFEEMSIASEEPLRPPPMPQQHFSPRHDVHTPSFSSVEEETPPDSEPEAPEPRIFIPVTPELSPREIEDAPVPTPRAKAPVPITMPTPVPEPIRVECAAQTVQETAVQTTAVIEVQTDAPTPEPVPVEETEPLSLSSGRSSTDSYLPSDSMLSDGQWLLDRSEGQHHDICVDWAMRQQLATAAMTRNRNTDSSTDLTAEVRTITEEGEAVGARRYEPQRDLLMQLLMEQQRHGRSGVVLTEMPAIFDSAAPTLISGDFESLSVGQVPRPVPRYRRRRSGDASGATSAEINDEGLEDTPVRDSGGSLPPGIIRVRESLNSDDAFNETQETERSHMGGTASDKMDIDLARYLGMSLNTTTGNSDDFTKTGMLSTTQLIQDALQATELSATGEPSNAAPLPRHRVNITVPTLEEVPSDSGSPDEDVSEILMP